MMTMKWESFEADEAKVIGAPPRGERKSEAADKPAGRKPAPAGAPRKAAPDAAPPAAPPPPAEPIETLLARARGEGRAAGFEEGVAHAEAQGQAALRMILSDLSEQLADALHARVEQEQALDRAARDLAEALLAGVAPALARQGLAAEVAAAVTEALRVARASPDAAPLRVRVGPGQVEAVRAALAEGGLGTQVDADPELGDLSARLDWADGEDDIDLEAALAAARAALDRHLPAPERRAANG
ncbi:hypothetical protein [Albimonas pacifica]|uniref:Flagellar biosynthesis/type III secretory pathway protein FliH n=1 Tax=Albimonas pacifica TaxID=1114924 RepID=A0A1I3FQK3_9RHOB|nr:hypothetical protein [Albimonas pacifica]SFI13495.1 Flagellar biosynthesis/type III secretory pathway protein FliH [Albimonas pacifica]